MACIWRLLDRHGLTAASAERAGRCVTQRL
jgi:hypothetical protein